MTRRRFYAQPEAFGNDRATVVLNADETQHLRTVLRQKPGDEVYVFDGDGREFRGEIETVVRDHTSIRIIEEVAPAAAESPLNLTMAVALLKGEKFDLVIQKLTELGVTSVIPLATTRADVRLKDDVDAGRRLTRWRRIVMEATKQCGRARLMTIERPIKFDQLVSNGTRELCLMFVEAGGGSFAETLATANSPLAGLTALVGSEGGWTEEEINDAREVGWQIVTLGERIMRAETAAIACAAMIQHRLGDLN